MRKFLSSVVLAFALLTPVVVHAQSVSPPIVAADPAALKALRPVSVPVVTPAPTPAPVVQSSSVIDIGAVFGIAAPYINSVIGSLIVLAIGWAKYEAHVKWNIDLDANALNTIQTALKNRAASLVADGGVRLNGVGLDVHNDMLAQEVNSLIARNPDSVSRLGLTPDRLAEMVVDKLPQVPSIAQAQGAALSSAQDSSQQPAPAGSQKFSPVVKPS